MILVATITDSLIGAAASIAAVVGAAIYNDYRSVRRSRLLQLHTEQQAKYVADVASAAAKLATARDAQAKTALVRTNEAIDVVHKLVNSNLTDTKRRLAAALKKLADANPADECARDEANHAQMDYETHLNAQEAA